MKMFKIHIASHHGFCSGVRRAITMTEQALSGIKKVYLLHELVHNEAVSAQLTAKGAVIVDDVSDVPDGAVVVTSAHGIPAAVESEIKRRNLQWVDATCPIVRRIHTSSDAVENGTLVILVGRSGHPETTGTLGRHPGKIFLVETADDVEKLPERKGDQEVMVLTQTTLSAAELAAPMTALRKKYGQYSGGDCRCYATAERQDAVKKLAGTCDCILIVGSLRSSNSCRLREVAETAGVKAVLVDDPDNFDTGIISGCRVVGVSSGASVPARQLDRLIDILEKAGGCR